MLVGLVLLSVPFAHHQQQISLILSVIIIKYFSWKNIMSGSGAGVCAKCGIAGVDDIQLEECDGCDLVLCGSDKCREEYREQHEEECQRRAEELHDRKLFRKPDVSHEGECPICFLPMPLDPTKTAFYSCCSQMICIGCDYANWKSSGRNRCPFCRESTVNNEEHRKRMMKRMKANDPAALCQMGTARYKEGDYDIAAKYWTKAAELGNVEAHYQLSTAYAAGKGVEKDEEKEVYHLEKAAIGGHPEARHNIGCVEEENGNTERAVKHFIIAANLGYEKSMKGLLECYKDGDITKEDLEATLRAHQAAIDEMKSPERDAAAAWRQRKAQRGLK